MAFDSLSYRDISFHTMVATRNMQEIGREIDTLFVVYLLGVFHTMYLWLSEGRLRTKANCKDNVNYSLIRIQQYTFTCRKLNATHNRTQRTVI
jgi:hypothetical protein